MKDGNRIDDERLRQILRGGDPLGEGEALDPVAARAMRRRVLGAAESAPRFGWGTVAVLATAALAVAAGLMLWLPGSPRGAGRVAEEPAAAAEHHVPALAEADEHRTEGPPAPAPEAAPVLVDRSPSAAHTPPAPRAPGPSLVSPAETAPRIAVATNLWDEEERPRQRQIQLTTSGGTQIIWVLNADVSL